MPYTISLCTDAWASGTYIAIFQGGWPRIHMIEMLAELMSIQLHTAISPCFTELGTVQICREGKYC
jgi:hypothetical protein